MGRTTRHALFCRLSVSLALSHAFAFGGLSEPRLPCWNGMWEYMDGTLPDAELPSAGVILVDPLSENLGGYCTERLRREGYACVQVLSAHLLNALDDPDGEADAFGAPAEGEEAQWAANLPFPIVGVLCESDAGLATAERLRCKLAGGTANEARRDKFLMIEAVRAAGLKAVRQAKAARWADADSFLRDLAEASEERSKLEGPDLELSSRAAFEGEIGGVKCVVKPSRGCASDDVFLCSGAAEAKRSFERILGSPRYGSPGAVNTEVLVQELCTGSEFAVDTVSRAGTHKALAVWRYDKRPTNGAPFVYYCTELRPAGGEEEKEVIQYALKVLDALGVDEGPAHIEVMLTSDGPTLIEFNGRWHVADFREVCDECVGYNALDAALDALVAPECFEALPDVPPPKLRKAARIAHLVCSKRGRLKAARHLEEAESMQSFRAIDVFPPFSTPGVELELTIDHNSDAGWVRLVHEDAGVVDAEYERLVALEPTMFEVEDIEDN